MHAYSMKIAEMERRGGEDTERLQKNLELYKTQLDQKRKEIDKLTADLGDSSSRLTASQKLCEDLKVQLEDLEKVI